jgi:hypothetical protein
MNNKGFHFRVPEVEKTNRKASMVFLTLEPVATMSFLGLDATNWKQGFTSDEDVFKWCAAGRFYHARTSGELSAGTNANDRQRLKKRDMFIQFWAWADENPEAFRGTEQVVREDVLREAIKTFGVHASYESVAALYTRASREEWMLAAIAKTINDSERHLKQIIRGLKRWVILDEQGLPRLLDSEKTDIHAMPDWVASIPDSRREGFLDWVRLNQAEIRRREKAREVALAARREAAKLQLLLGQG